MHGATGDDYRETEGGTTPLDMKLNDLYTRQHAKGNRESSPQQIWDVSNQLSGRRSMRCSSSTSSPTAPGGGRRASGVVRAEQVPPSTSPSDAALPPPLPRQRRSSGREPHCGARSLHLLRRVNHPARRMRTFRWMPRASSMCSATEVPRFLSRDASHANLLAAHKTGNTQMRHLRPGPFRMIEDHFYARSGFSAPLLRTVLPSLIGLRIPGGPGEKEFLPFSLSDTVSGSAHGNNPEKRARKTSRKKSNMISESG